MTCKDCPHYEACKGTYMNVSEYKSITDFDGEHYADIYHCPDFADKSEWVHLPCKVGDIVYCFEPCFDTDHHPKLKVVEKEIVELKTIATVFGLNFDIDSIGKTIFLTREEAEEALKKQRKDSNGGKIKD